MTTTGLIARVGGLAVALGAGAVISLAASAHASAEPTDSAREGSAGPAAARHATPSPRRADATARTGRSEPARPAAAKKSEPAASSPAPAATPARRPGDPRGRLITIYKGTHFAIPNSFGFFIRQAKGTGTFTTDTVYDVKDVDQYDWNKFTGIAFTPLQPDRNSAMVGWRYNLQSQQFEIAPFYNVDKKRILPNEQTEVISVPADETFTYTVDYTGITISYGGVTKFKAYPDGLTPNVW